MNSSLPPTPARPEPPKTFGLALPGQAEKIRREALRDLARIGLAHLADEFDQAIVDCRRQIGSNEAILYIRVTADDETFFACQRPVFTQNFIEMFPECPTVIQRCEQKATPLVALIVIRTDEFMLSLYWPVKATEGVLN